MNQIQLLLKNKKTVFILSLVFISIGNENIYAQQPKPTQETYTKIWDWSLPPNSLPSPTYTQGKKCGNISFHLNKGNNVFASQILIKPMLHDNLSNTTFGGIGFSLSCTVNPDLNNSWVLFNSKNQQWEPIEESKEGQADQDRTYFSDAKTRHYKTHEMYQIKTENISGWMETYLDYYSNYKIYTKTAHFCLYNKNKTKGLCGFGDVQVIPTRKQLGTKKFDYTPILLNILQSTQFLDDK